MNAIRWTPSKAMLLTSIHRAAQVGQAVRVNDFNKRDVAWFREVGLVHAERLELTDKGLRKIRS